MVRKFAQLQEIDNDHEITKQSDHEFLFRLKVGLLLALKDQGLLSTLQHRAAEERLLQQRRKYAQKRQADVQTKE